MYYFKKVNFNSIELFLHVFLYILDIIEAEINSYLEKQHKKEISMTSKH